MHLASTLLALNLSGVQVLGGHAGGHLGRAGRRQLPGSRAALPARQQCPWGAHLQQQGGCCGCTLPPAPPAVAPGRQLQVGLQSISHGRLPMHTILLQLQLQFSSMFAMSNRSCRP